MFAIVACGRDWSMGRNGGLLINLPPDLKRFKEITMGKAVIMGRTTLLTLPKSKPLKGRENFILSRNTDYKVEDAVVINSYDEAKEIAEKYGDGIACIGGAEVYKLLLPLCDKVYLTRIDADFADADKFFPNLDELGWSKGDEEHHEYEGINFSYITYTK